MTTSNINMDSEDRFNQALGVAQKVHKGVVRLNGEPYIYHPIRVAKALSSLSERIVGVLHDVLEERPESRLIPEVGNVKRWVLDVSLEPNETDSQVPLYDYEAEALAVLSRHKPESYQTYIDTIKRVGGIAVVVKLADIADNLTDLPPAKESLRKRYEKARAELFPLVCNE